MINKNTILSVATVLTLLSANVLAETNTKVYASVNGTDITATDVALVLKDPRVQFETLPKEQQKQILNQLIDGKLLSATAMKTDVVNSKIYKETLEKTIQTLKQDLALRIWMQDIAKNIVVEEENIKKYYNENKAKFKKPIELKASHILLKTQKEAEEIIENLNKSKDLKLDFTKTAKTKSKGPSGTNGGELGWFTTDKMVAEFSEATMKLNVGAITQTPVKTQFGYHIIYLDDKKSSSFVSLDMAQNEIKQFLGQEIFKNKIEKIIKEKKATAKIIYK